MVERQAATEAALKLERYDALSVNAESWKERMPLGLVVAGLVAEGARSAVAARRIERCWKVVDGRDGLSVYFEVA